MAINLVHSSLSGPYEIYKIDRDGRIRALKCLKPSLRGQNLYEDLLRKEFDAVCGLRHPNIVEYYSFTSVEELGSCIEMEWVDGVTLDELIKNGDVTKELEDKILNELCDALIYLNGKGVLHRDLKPSNVMVTRLGQEVRLIDFSLADSSAHSILKAPAGATSFAAPEVLQGGEADIRSEIYSLGLVIASISKRHRLVAKKCCETRPSRRYASVKAVKEALKGRSMLWAGICFILLILVATYFSISRD